MKSPLFLILFVILFTSCRSNRDKLFEVLTSDKTGITFSNDINPTEQLNPFNFTNFYNGGGVAIADFNQDGLPDLCFVANQKDPELYISQGKLKFEKAGNTGLRNPGWATGISVCDVNQDGWPDIYISMASHSGISHSANQLYINQKTQTPSFKEEAAEYGLSYDGFTTQTVFFDYDNDGDLDAFLLNTAPDVINPNYFRQSVNNGTYPSSDKLFENKGLQANGRYHFEDVSVKAGILYEGLGLGVGLADFNNDGFTDIYVSNDFQSDDVFYLNNGNGTFRNIIKSATKHTALSGMGIDVADFNNDGLMDIYQLDMLPENSERLKLMVPRGDYEKKQLSISPEYNYTLQYMRNMLQVNTGISDSIPYFSEQGLMQNIAATDWSWSALFADLDLDGRKDLFVTNGYRKNVTDLDFLTYYKGQVLFGGKKNVEAIQMEILKEVPEIQLRNYAYRNIPQAGFADVSEDWGLNTLSYSNGAAYADLDLDGDLDLVVNNIDEEALVYENKAQGKNHLKINFEGNPGNREGIGALVKVYTGDTCQVYQNFPAKGYLSSMNTDLIIGLGNSSADSLEVIWPGGFRQKKYKIAENTSLSLRQSDSQHPGEQPARQGSDPLFISQPTLSSYVHKESRYIDFHQTPTLQKMLSRNGPVIKQADFNGDGLEDIVIGGSCNGSPTLVFYQKNGSFLKADTLDNGQMEVGDLVVFDANNDGKTDILLLPGFAENASLSSETYQPKLFLNQSTGFSLSPAFPKLNICSKAALATDINNDGQPDLIIGGWYTPEKFPYAEESLVLINTNGSFQKQENSWLKNRFAISAMVAADIDGDKDEDILFTGNWGGVVLLQKNGTSYKEIDLKIPSGWWHSLAVADTDNDGDLDLVLGNEGLNSIFKASGKQPVSLFAKDFNKDGRMDPIWGLYLQGKEVTVHPLGTLTDQIVQFKQRYTSYKNYSKASLEDLFTSGDLKGALQLRATELRSGVAVNNGNGTFTFNPLPFAAQEAPINSILAADFTGDGKNELLLLANFFDNESTFGQSDASYGLLYDGLGMKNITNRRSGLFLPGNNRNGIYLPGAGLLIVTQNNGPLRIFKHIAAMKINQ